MNNKICKACEGAGDTAFGRPCDQCGGFGCVKADGTKLKFAEPTPAAQTTRDPGLLWIAHNGLIKVIKARVQRPLDRLPEGRADDLIHAMEDAVELTKVLSVLREEIKQREVK